MSDRDFAKDLERVLETGPKVARPVVGAAMPSTRDTVTVGNLRQALDALLQDANAAAGMAQDLRYRLSGGEVPKGYNLAPVPDRTGDAPMPVFQALGAQIVQVSRMVSEVQASLKRMHEVLQ